MVIAYLFLFSNLFFLPNKQAPSTALRNEGRRMTQIQKTGTNMQSLKKRGNGAVGVRNEGSFAIYPNYNLQQFYTYLIFPTEHLSSEL